MRLVMTGDNGPDALFVEVIQMVEEGRDVRENFPRRLYGKKAKVRSEVRTRARVEGSVI